MSESSATIPPADSLGEPAARIRSLSTLLRWVSQQGVITGTSLRRDQGAAQFLDSVALMFVSGRRCSDAAAVIPIFDPAEGYGLTVVAQGYNLARVKSHVVEADTRYVKVLNQVDVLSELLPSLGRTLVLWAASWIC